MAHRSNPNLGQALYELAFSDSSDFTALAHSAGLDPGHDFVGADLAHCDLANQDLREFNFADADLRHCRFYKTIFLKEHVRGAKFPLARAALIDSYVRILGHNYHARAYLSHYYKNRAAGSVVTRILAHYLTSEERGQPDR